MYIHSTNNKRSKMKHNLRLCCIIALMFLSRENFEMLALRKYKIDCECSEESFFVSFVGAYEITQKKY